MCTSRMCSVASFAIASGASERHTSHDASAARAAAKPSEGRAFGGSANARSSVNRSPSCVNPRYPGSSRAECAAPYAPGYPDPSLSGLSRAPRRSETPRRSPRLARAPSPAASVRDVFSPSSRERASRDVRRRHSRQRLTAWRRRRGWCGMSKICSVARWNVFIFPSSRSLMSLTRRRAPRTQRHADPAAIWSPAAAAYAIRSRAVAARPASVPYAPTSIAETSVVPRSEGSQGTAPANIVHVRPRQRAGSFPVVSRNNTRACFSLTARGSRNHATRPHPRAASQGAPSPRTRVTRTRALAPGRK